MALVALRDKHINFLSGHEDEVKFMNDEEKSDWEREQKVGYSILL